MLNFPHSTFTWKGHPWEPDPYYKWPGGFVGKHGQFYHVRFNLESRCEIIEIATGKSAELFLGAPCRNEYTIAKRNLFQIPSGEWRFAFSHQSSLSIATRPSTEAEPASASKLSEKFQDVRIDIRTFSDVEDLTDANQIVEAVLNNEVLNAYSTYQDQGFTVTVEYPVNLINVHVEEADFQVCTGPILLPDLATWNGEEVERVFVAHVAISDFDFVEFILRREVEAAPEERSWLGKPRGRDRHELIDPNNEPPNYPPERQKPLVYNETWELEATNVVQRAVNI